MTSAENVGFLVESDQFAAGVTGLPFGAGPRLGAGLFQAGEPVGAGLLVRVGRHVLVGQGHGADAWPVPQVQVPVRGGVGAAVGDADFGLFVGAVVGVDLVDTDLDVGDVARAVDVLVRGQRLAGRRIGGAEPGQHAGAVAVVVGLVVHDSDTLPGQVPHGLGAQLAFPLGQGQPGQHVVELAARDRVQQCGGGVGVVLPLGQRGQVGQGHRVVAHGGDDLDGERGGLAGSGDVFAAAAGGAADHGGVDAQVEHRLHGSSFLAGGERVAGQAGHGHGQSGVAGAGQARSDDARQRQSSGAGGGLAAVAVHGDVGHAGFEVVAGHGLDRHDDQRHQDADFADGGGQLADATPCVPQVVRVLRDLVRSQFDHDGDVWRGIGRVSDRVVAGRGAGGFVCGVGGVGGESHRCSCW